MLPCGTGPEVIGVETNKHQEDVCPYMRITDNQWFDHYKTLWFHVTVFKIKLLLETETTRPMARRRRLHSGICAIIAAVALTACDGNSIEGRWIEPVPGMDNQVQGIDLEKGGKASSINMATLQYEKWEKKGDMLILSGKSIGNHETILFSDTLTIVNLSEDRLSLKKGDLTIDYAKE